MSLTDHNSTKANWEIDTDGFEFVKLQTLTEGQHYPLRGCFVSPDNGYGRGAVLISNDRYVNIPQRNVEMIEDVCRDQSAVDEINSGKAFFWYECFKTKQGQTGYQIYFGVDE